MQTPRGQRYTRNGAFTINATGQLVTNEGYQVLGDSGPITFQSTDHDIVISANGIITVQEGTNASDSPRGELQVFAFDQRNACKRTATRCFLAPNGVNANPAPLGTRVVQGAVEKSNVNGVAEMARLIEITRSYTDIANILQQQSEQRRNALTQLSQSPATIIDEFLEAVKCVRLIPQRPEWRRWTFRSRSSPAISPICRRPASRASAPSFRVCFTNTFNASARKRPIQGNILPVGIEIGAGVKTVGTPRLMTQGSLSQTGNSLDVAIQGDGWFKIQMPDGTYSYTRDGSFQQDAQGRIVTAEGNVVQPAITIPQNATGLTINNQGQVSVTLPGSTSSSIPRPIRRHAVLQQCRLAGQRRQSVHGHAGVRHAAGYRSGHRRRRHVT